MCNSQKKLPYNIEMIIINKIIWIMELHVLAMIDCVGFDMVNNAVEIFQG